MLRGISRPFTAFSGNSRLGLIVTVGLGVLTFVLIYAALQEEEQASQSAAAGSAVAVVRATQSIPAGTQITPGMLELTTVPEEAALSGRIESLDLAVGQVARIPILSGEQMVQAKLVALESFRSTGSGLNYIIPDGLRAMAIKVDKVIAPGGLLQPGHRVDILAGISASTIDPVTGEPADDVTRLALVAQNIEVLAVEQALERVLPAQASQEREETLTDQPEPNPATSVVTLAVTPAEARQIVEAEREGAIRLLLRPTGDTDEISLQSTELAAAAAVTSSNDLPLSVETSISYIVPPGLRGMAIAVDEVIGVGGLLRPGDRVDVISVFDLVLIAPDDEAIDGEEITVAVTVAQNVEVLAVQQALENPPAAAAGGEGAEAEAGGGHAAGGAARGQRRDPGAHADRGAEGADDGKRRRGPAVGARARRRQLRGPGDHDHR